MFVCVYVCVCVWFTNKTGTRSWGYCVLQYVCVFVCVLWCVPLLALSVCYEMCIVFNVCVSESLLALLSVCDGGHRPLALADITDTSPLAVHRLLPKCHLRTNTYTQSISMIYGILQV